MVEEVEVVAEDALRGGRGRGGRGGYRANVTGTQGEFFKESGASLVDFEELRQVKEKYGNFEDQAQELHSGDFINFAYIDEGNYAHASIPTQISKLNWILDLRASKHVTGTSSEFVSYTQCPPTHKETIQTADGTSQPIKGVGIV
jgi:hypothetical protein